MTLSRNDGYRVHSLHALCSLWSSTYFCVAARQLLAVKNRLMFLPFWARFVLLCVALYRGHQKQEHLAQLVVVDVFLSRGVALDQQLLAVDRQVGQVRQRADDSVCLLKLAEAKALGLVRLRVLHACETSFCREGLEVRITPASSNSQKPKPFGWFVSGSCTYMGEGLKEEGLEALMTPSASSNSQKPQPLGWFVSGSCTRNWRFK